MSETNNNKPADTSTKVQEEWLIRPCNVYDEEYSDCTSIRARFNQYFIFGKTTDCSQWKKDSDNCYKWIENKDTKAANQLVQSEKQRRKERLMPHYQNNVWERRKAPPENWNTPLPEHISKDYEYSYLNIKNREMKGEIPPSMDISNSCTII